MKCLGVKYYLISKQVLLKSKNVRVISRAIINKSIDIKNYLAKLLVFQYGQYIDITQENFIFAIKTVYFSPYIEILYTSLKYLTIIQTL